jgi:uncharacterized membrane protein/predicted DsbA family dithiol-disulfide isomerase
MMTTPDMTDAQPFELRAARAPSLPTTRRCQAILLLSLVGLALSVVLTVVHYRTHTDPDYQALCAVSDRINCESVALSPYSLWLDVPVSVWGLLSYLASGALALSGLSSRRLHADWPMGLLTLLAAGAVAVSGYLAYISVRRIDSVCIYCTGLYVVNVCWFGVAVWGRFSWRAWLESAKLDARELFGRPRLTVALGATAVATIALLQVGFPRHWLGARAGGADGEHSGSTNQGEHWIGSPDAALTIVEYTDYECPHCRRAHRDVRERIARSAVPARLVHKHFPLDQACNLAVNRPFHRRACELSRFVECAGRQGKFWPANDAVFAALDHTEAARLDLTALGRELGLDGPGLARCLTDDEVAELVARDIADGQSLGIHGTPTYVVGEARYTGRLPPSLLEAPGSSSAVGPRARP